MNIVTFIYNPEFRRQRLEDWEFETRWNYITRPCLNMHPHKEFLKHYYVTRQALSFLNNYVSRSPRGLILLRPFAEGLVRAQAVTEVVNCAAAGVKKPSSGAFVCVGS